jgi:hypothetical protein
MKRFWIWVKGVKHMNETFPIRFFDSQSHNPKSKTCTELSRSIQNEVVGRKAK